MDDFVVVGQPTIFSSIAEGFPSKFRVQFVAVSVFPAPGYDEASLVLN